jgi:hypothetical protein
MSVVSGKTNSYGPGTVDIQIEQGADFVLPLRLKDSNGDPIDLTDVDLEAHCSPTWSPGQRLIPFTITKDPDQDANKGRCTVSLPAASTAPGSEILGTLPRPGPSAAVDALKFQLGNWVFNATLNGVITRLIDGKVILDRDPVGA